ncbi:MAG: sigma-54-dependent Fis family transcriptional regulator [Deltaproteobacteria bacterium]|nr:sigma-54-dependent Fis family transcriptional regulator [Deltaproteobacteria bacterium]
MTRPRSEHPVLIVDDEKNIRRALRMVLEGEGLEVSEAATIAEAEAALAGAPHDLVLLDVKLGEGNGIDLLERIKSAPGAERDIPVLMISGHATVDDAVRATRLGAFDFLEKPLDRERVIVSVRNALERRAMGREVATLRAAESGRHEMIGESPVMQELFRQVARIAPTKGRVLVTGESGTGKELIARAIHRTWLQSLGLAELGRRGGEGNVPFVKVNCAAIPPELIESELFGHERGAFTGAVGRKRGLFEIADGGTIFLDEIGDMSLPAQAKVLRVLQQGEIVRVGGEKVLTVDCRVIAATNKNLTEEVAAGRFREDLFFRLNVIPIRAPSLRERPEDIPLLAEAFVRLCCDENGFRPKRISPEVLSRLTRHPWPGNVRELRNVIERLVILADDEISARDLPPYLEAGGPHVRGSAGSPIPGVEAPSLVLDPRRYLSLTLREFRDQVEREFLRLKLEQNQWNVSRTAQELEIERTNLHKRLRALGIERE